MIAIRIRIARGALLSALLCLAAPPVTAATVSGIVIGADGAPLEDVTVRAGPSRATTNDQGRFRLRRLPAADVVLRVQQPVIGHVAQRLTAPAQGVVVYLHDGDSRVLRPSRWRPTDGGAGGALPVAHAATGPAARIDKQAARRIAPTHQTVRIAMARWNEGEVVDNVHWTDTDHSLRVRADVAPFKAGQFGRLALEVDGKPMGRPYSFVNPPQDAVLEFYSTVVPEGPISPRLHALTAGDRVLVGPKAGGYFTLDQVPDADHLWLLATGTALGPFLSILRTDEPWRRFKRIVLVHAARRVMELTYREVIDALAERHGAQFRFVPFVSRESADFAMPGRVPAAIDTGALEQRMGLPLDPARSQVMICGNPDMVRDTQQVLAGRGFAANTRRQRGQVTTEQYW